MVFTSSEGSSPTNPPVCDRHCRTVMLAFVPVNLVTYFEILSSSESLP
jgi:hypothetical protein